MTTTRDIKIEVEHITRVEGHGDIVLNAKDGTIEKLQWNVTEAPRMFESFVKGKPYDQLNHITSRICGICSIGHSLASLKATESAMNVEISRQTEMLRKLALHAENMQSHVLHVGYLVAPDMFGVGSVFPMIKTHPQTVGAVVKLHRLSNELSDLVCGRTTHPTNLKIGGIWKIPTKNNLLHIKKNLEEGIDTFYKLAEVILGNAHVLPNFQRETEYIALTSELEYALYDGLIGSSDTGKHPVDDYRSIANEFMVPHSTAKYARHARDSYMVGALARYNMNGAQLKPMARKWAEDFNLKRPNYNPFMNNVAQVVEFIHSLEDSIDIIDQLAERELTKESVPNIKPKAGRGIGAIEVPRGILFHDYTYNDKGICVNANCVIPTNQNHNNIQKDMEAFAPTLLDLPQEKIVLNLEMLVRAYDPCISCSTHYLNVKFK